MVKSVDGGSDWTGNTDTIGHPLIPRMKMDIKFIDGHFYFAAMAYQLNTSCNVCDKSSQASVPHPSLGRSASDCCWDVAGVGPLLG